jgi:hypothetical protein
MKRFVDFIVEDGVAVNNAGGGQIAGMGIDNPNIPSPKQGEPSGKVAFLRRKKINDQKARR